MITIKSDFIKKGINYAGEKISSPQQRVIIGVTALVLQPAIDMFNKKTDKDTKVLAACKSEAKAIAGMSSGYVVRRACISIADKLSKPGKILCPKNLAEVGTANKYGDTIGTLLATFVMLGTNFIWDAPVTKKLTNFFYSHFSSKEAK